MGTAGGYGWEGPRRQTPRASLCPPECTPGTEVGTHLGHEVLEAGNDVGALELLVVAEAAGDHDHGDEGQCQVQLGRGGKGAGLMRRGRKLPVRGHPPASCPLVFLGSPVVFPALLETACPVPCGQWPPSPCPPCPTPSFPAVPVSCVPIAHILCILNPTSPMSPYPMTCAPRPHASFPASSESCIPHVTVLCPLMFSCPIVPVLQVSCSVFS